MVMRKMNAAKVSTLGVRMTARAMLQSTYTPHPIMKYGFLLSPPMGVRGGGGLKIVLGTCPC